MGDDAHTIHREASDLYAIVHIRHLRQAAYSSYRLETPYCSEQNGSGTGMALVLMRDGWSQIPEAIRLGRRTFGIIRQIISFGIGFTVLVISATTQAVPDVM